LLCRNDPRRAPRSREASGPNDARGIKADGIGISDAAGERQAIAISQDIGPVPAGMQGFMVNSILLKAPFD